MTGSLMLLLAAGVMRLLTEAVWSWLALVRDRSRRGSLEAMIRAAGSDVTIMDRCPDGGMLAVWTRDSSAVHHRSERAL